MIYLTSISLSTLFLPLSKSCSDSSFSLRKAYLTSGGVMWGDPWIKLWRSTTGRVSNIVQWERLSTSITTTGASPAKNPWFKFWNWRVIGHQNIFFRLKFVKKSFFKLSHNPFSSYVRKYWRSTTMWIHLNGDEWEEYAGIGCHKRYHFLENFCQKRPHQFDRLQRYEISCYDISIAHLFVPERLQLGRFIVTNKFCALV